FGPDGKLYIPVGAPCNICESDSIYSAIHRLDVETKKLELFASGIRNSVGFDWHPETNELWFTENGRDWMNDTMPPDELNKASQKGMHFGYPYCHAGMYADNQFGDKRNCSEFTKPEINLGPHVAALGMKFYEGKMFPGEYKHSVFIAEHGSWNRKDPLGYRITFVKIKDNKAISYSVFAEGWLQGDEAWGRPVDILELPDGSLLVSDDFGDRIFRISY
ncbi:MAG: PQQ-dependent sugar dehydrogenase, partial [Bacteroidota bacterium]